MKKRQIDTPEFQEGEVVEEWSRKRILIGISVVIFVLGAGIYMLGGKKQSYPTQETLSATDEQLPQEVQAPSKEEVSNIIDEAKESLGKITSENITSSTSAIQKIIKDLEKLQGEDKNAKNIICKSVCFD